MLCRKTTQRVDMTTPSFLWVLINLASKIVLISVFGFLTDLRSVARKHVKWLRNTRGVLSL